MRGQQDSKDYDSYVDYMAQIRHLSSPELLATDDENKYSRRLHENFRTIGELARRNQSILNEQILPILESEGPLSQQQVEHLTELSDKLMSMGGVEEFEHLDLPMMSKISDRLIHDARMQGDVSRLIEQLDVELSSCYMLMNVAMRITVHPSYGKYYRDVGLKIGDFFFDYLDKDRFLTIDSVDARGLVLTNARFVIMFYEHDDHDARANERCLAVLDRMLALIDDPFYFEAVPGFDWNYFKYRTFEYFLHCTDVKNRRGFSASQLNLIADMADRLDELCASDPAYFDNVIGRSLVPVLGARCRYLAGRIDEAAFKETLLEHYRRRDPHDFGSESSWSNLVIPSEFLGLVSSGSPTEEDRRIVSRMYEDMSTYVFHTPGIGTLSFVLSCLTDVLENYLEVEDGATIEEFVLRSFAALHPPTYVHSYMVARLSEELCDKLIEHRPELLVGTLGCKDVEDVRRRRGELLDYIRHAALCHDFGKIAILDTIFMYGRRLQDFEFGLIKAHPDMGARLLSAHASTRAYADIARGHHRYYDGTSGYPEEFDTGASPVKTLIDLVCCADCMDAATDTVGRSYNRGKTLDDFLVELRDGAGTRYAPWLVDLLDLPDVHAGIRAVLNDGRDQIYRETYYLLRSVSGMD